MSQLKPSGAPHHSIGQQLNAPSNPFAKALLEAGGTATEVVDSAIQLGADMLSSLLTLDSASSPTSTPSDSSTASNSVNPNPDFTPNLGRGLDSAKSYSAEDMEKEWQLREQRMLRHREVQRMDVYDGEQVKRDRKIQQILEQLQALAKDLDAASKQAKIAVMQSVHGRAGEYHVTFFEKLLFTLTLLRKRVQDSTSWLATFNRRGTGKKDYWGMLDTQGTTWAMSGERAIATSVG